MMIKHEQKLMKRKYAEEVRRLVVDYWRGGNRLETKEDMLKKILDDCEVDRELSESELDDSDSEAIIASEKEEEKIIIPPTILKFPLHSISVVSTLR